MHQLRSVSKSAALPSSRISSQSAFFATDRSDPLAAFVREEAYFRTTEETRQAPPPVKFSQEAPQPEAEIKE